MCIEGFYIPSATTSEHLNSAATQFITIILWTPHCYIKARGGQDLSVCSKTSKVKIRFCGDKSLCSKKKKKKKKSFMAMAVIHLLISKVVHKKQLKLSLDLGDHVWMNDASFNFLKT